MVVKKPHVVAACDDLQRKKQYEEAVVAKPNAIVHALTVVVAPEDARVADPTVIRSPWLRSIAELTKYAIREGITFLEK